MSLLTLSKRIIGKDKKTAPVRNKKLKSVATSATKKKQPVDEHALTSGRIGLIEVVSEKGILQQAQGTVVFKVLRHVTKGQMLSKVDME